MALRDPYLPASSPLHHTDARVKLILVIAFLLAAALIPPSAWPVFPILLSFCAAGGILSGVRAATLFNRSLLASPLILAAIPLLFTVPGPEIGVLTAGPIRLSIHAAGLERFLVVALKSGMSVFMAVLLSATTPMPDLLAAMRSLGIPRLIVATIGLMWRYLFLMAGESERLIRARAARSGFRAEGRGRGGTLAWRAKTTGGMAGSLLLRSLERSERVYAAMQARGYDGEIRSLPTAGITRRDRTLLSAVLIVFLLITFWGILIG